MPPAKKFAKKTKSGSSGRTLRLVVAILFLTALVSALVFLSHRRERQQQARALPSLHLPSETAPPPLPSSPPSPGEDKRPPRPLPSPPSKKMKGERPQVAIVMDDLGRSLDYGKALLAIDVPVTFAILPGEPHAAALAEMAHRHGREIMIHLPMEPQDYPATDPGSDALLVTMPAPEIQQRVEAFRQLVPHAVGGNNHMGSRFTEDREGMRAVLTVLREADLFFLDSLTTHESVASAEAREARVPVAMRDVFLDNVPEVEKIASEIHHLVAVARRQGRAIGICHPYPQTLEALRRTAKELRQAGVELVPVAALVR